MAKPQRLGITEAPDLESDADFDKSYVPVASVDDDGIVQPRRASLARLQTTIPQQQIIVFQANISDNNLFPPLPIPFTAGQTSPFIPIRWEPGPILVNGPRLALIGGDNNTTIELLDDGILLFNLQLNITLEEGSGTGVNRYRTVIRDNLEGNLTSDRIYGYLRPRGILGNIQSNSLDYETTVATRTGVQYVINFATTHAGQLGGSESIASRVGIANINAIRINRLTIFRFP